MTADSDRSITQWVFPVLGAVTFLFTLLNGVPWISKGEFAVYVADHERRWQGVDAHQREDAEHFRQLEDAHDQLIKDVQELRANQREVQAVLKIHPRRP